jgi:hypothetical protein
MMKPYLLVFFCCFSNCAINAQSKSGEAYNKELSFTIENDAFLLNKADAYYTNGIFLKETRALERKGLKKLRSLELGQMLYTPLIRLTQTAKDIDRPYCGYLFLKLNQTEFAKNGGIWQYGASLATVGAASLGEDMQHWYHKMLGYGQFTGWKYQVQTAAGIDLNLSYARTVFEDSSWIKLVPALETQVGTTFTNAKLGMYTCLGSFAKNANSALWTARVQRKEDEEKRKAEIFLYWYPQIILQGYNATVEGGLFDKSDSTAVLGVTNRWMFQQAWGFSYAKGRWTTKLAIVYQTREAVAQTKVQRYGSIQVGYRIH